MRKRQPKRRKPTKAEKAAESESFFWVIIIGFLFLALFAYLYYQG